MENQERLKYLRIFFNASTASFAFMETLMAQTGRELPGKTKEMYDLHKEAKAELEKEEPNIDRISFILQQCEILAAMPDMPKDFEPGVFMVKLHTEENPHPNESEEDFELRKMLYQAHFNTHKRN